MGLARTVTNLWRTLISGEWPEARAWLLRTSSSLIDQVGELDREAGRVPLLRQPR